MGTYLTPTYKNIKRIYEIWDLIVDKFGQSKFYDWVPNLIIYNDPKLNYAYKGYVVIGEFCTENKDISINLASHTNIKSVISTILHEYCHYLQAPQWYTRYDIRFGYDNNPYEIVADNFAKEHIGLFI